MSLSDKVVASTLVNAGTKTAKTGDDELLRPEIIDLGEWPSAEEKIRKRALDQGMSPEEIELLLEEIREARRVELGERENDISVN